MADASDVGIGAVFQQHYGKELRPVAYYCKKLSTREMKYSAGERELMAIVYGIEYFKAFLYGKQFIVRSDHQPLSWLRDHAKPSCRLARWLIKVREYDFRIEFIPGVKIDYLAIFSSTRWKKKEIQGLL